MKKLCILLSIFAICVIGFTTSVNAAICIPSGQNIFIEWNRSMEIDVKGYDVYRNGEKITTDTTLVPQVTLPEAWDPETDPIPRVRFVDLEAPEGIHTYNIVAVDQCGNKSLNSAESEEAVKDNTAANPVTGVVVGTTSE